MKKPSSGARDEKAEKAQNLEKNKKRIAKMKEMYQMFIKMEREQEGGGAESFQDEAEEDKQAEPMVDPRTMSPDYQQIMTTPQP